MNVTERPFRGIESLEIRPVCEEDAQKVIEYINLVSGESDYLSFGENEFKITVEEEREIIRSFRERDNCLMIAARLGEKIVGLLTFEGGHRERLKHRGEFGLTVAKEYWGMGIGKRLIEYMIETVKKNGITRIGLQVRADNERAIKLYSNFGFVTEGRLKRFMKIREKYFDFLQMGKDL
ncbi:MAG TPA: GNAT family N-acetyltransferase [Mesotoga infera]|nr:GNAT family N-acetyltransferase [Mesotoga infera]HRR43980.1 GNAT family N-acetyltransferase [Mesotoga sp.]HRV01083.1 GNAT family N-acetyltransferase [Mesotoga sp.]